MPRFSMLTRAEKEAFLCMYIVLVNGKLAEKRYYESDIPFW